MEKSELAAIACPTCRTALQLEQTMECDCEKCQRIKEVGPAEGDLALCNVCAEIVAFTSKGKSAVMSASQWVDFQSNNVEQAILMLEARREVQNKQWSSHAVKH